MAEADKLEKVDIVTEDTVKKSKTMLGHFGSLVVGRMYKEGKVVTREEQDEARLEVPIPDPRVPLGKIGFGCRMTVNMGNFESIQLSVNVELPCMASELESGFRAAKSFVDMRLNTEIAALKDYREKKDN